MNELEIVYVDINDLKPAEYNPRAMDEKEAGDLGTSLDEFGMVEPVVVNGAKDRKNIIIGGHQRYFILKQKGETKVPVVYVDIEDEYKERELNLRLNKNTGHWDWDQLANFDVEELKNVGFDPKELEKNFGVDIVEDEAPEISKEEPISKLGEIYQLGRHRLMCGDSTKIEDVEKLINGQKADMVFTDPPYGVDYSSRVDKDKRKPWGGIINDDLEGEKLREFLYDSLSWLQCPKYVCCNWQSVVDFFLALGKPNSFIVWDKGSIGLGAGYRNQHEIVLFYGTLDHNSETNVWSIRRDSTSGYEHPTQKPVAISARAIGNHKADNVLDLFGGSGSTLIACEQLNRTCYMMELDPRYIDVIITRWEKFTGQKALMLE